MSKSNNTVSTERSSVFSRFQLLSPSHSHRSLMNSNGSGRHKLTRTLSRTFSLRCFQSKADKRSDSVPKEISVGTRKEFRLETAKRASSTTPKEIKIESPMEIHIDGCEATGVYAPKEIVFDVRKEIATKQVQGRGRDSPEEICTESLWKSPRKNSASRRKDTKQLDCLFTPPSDKKKMIVPTLMSPRSKAPYFRGAFDDHKPVNGSDGPAEGNDKSWKLERPPMLSRASPPLRRTFNRYASSNNLLSVHTTPARPMMHRQTSVYIPKADLDNLCNMYDDIVDTPFRSH